MAKKVIILIIIVLLLIISGGSFWWFKIRQIKGSPDDYVIKETEQGTIIENKKAGLIVKALEGWIVQKIEFLEGSLVVYTQDLESKREDGRKEPPLEKGCGIETSVIYKKMTFDEIKEKIKDIHFGLGIKSEEFEAITIKNQQALKNTFDSEVLGPGISVYFSGRNKLYSFAVYWAAEDKERCLQEFDKFLANVLIE